MSAEANIQLSGSEFERLPNLNLLMDRIEEKLVQRSELGVLSITLIRRDGNDSEDHWDAYETLLREITVFLSRYSVRRLRRSDLLLEPSLAGNTFVILLGPPRENRALHKTDLSVVRDRLTLGVKAHLRHAIAPHTREPFGIYVGGAIMHHDHAVASDRIVYRALEESIADAMGQRKREAREQTVNLMRLIESERVQTVYQPVVDVVERRVIGVEALTRPPREEFTSPELLFEAAHREGVLWPLERLCRRRALESLPPLQAGQFLFLNTEPDSMYDPALRQRRFIREMERAGLDPRRLVLEVTEHAVVKDFATLRRALDEVRKMGFLLAMDDVGSGYAGLQAIAEMRPDYLKMDMTLVRGMHLDPFKRELIATIRRFTDSMGIVLIAEGVEHVAELESLSAVGVRCAQGYLFARPDASPRQPDWESLVSP